MVRRWVELCLSDRSMEPRAILQHRLRGHRKPSGSATGSNHQAPNLHTSTTVLHFTSSAHLSLRRWGVSELPRALRDPGSHHFDILGIYFQANFKLFWPRVNNKLTGRRCLETGEFANILGAIFDNTNEGNLLTVYLVLHKPPQLYQHELYGVGELNHMQISNSRSSCSSHEFCPSDVTKILQYSRVYKVECQGCEASTLNSYGEQSSKIQQVTFISCTATYTNQASFTEELIAEIMETLEVDRSDIRVQPHKPECPEVHLAILKLFYTWDICSV